jgi:hypothetical protein
VSALRLLAGGGVGGPAPWPGQLVPVDLALELERSAGSYAGDAAAFVRRALPIVTEVVPLPASAEALRRTRLYALTGGGQRTGGRAVLRVAG